MRRAQNTGADAPTVVRAAIPVGFVLEEARGQMAGPGARLCAKHQPQRVESAAAGLRHGRAPPIEDTPKLVDTLQPTGVL